MNLNGDIYKFMNMPYQLTKWLVGSLSQVQNYNLKDLGQISCYQRSKTLFLVHYRVQLWKEQFMGYPIGNKTQCAHKYVQPLIYKVTYNTLNKMHAQPKILHAYVGFQ